MKRRFRGWLILLLCVLFSALVFAGCSTGNDGGDQTDDQQQGQQEPGDPEQPGGEDPEYTVTFVTNGGTEQDAMQYTGEALTLPEPFRYNYVFDGWFADEGLTGEAVSSSGYVPVSDVTLYAKWTPCVYLYLYYGVDGFEVERRTYFEGDSIRVSELFTPDAITVEGTECPFTGWTYEDGTAIKGDEIVFGKENVLLLANYDESKIPPKKYLTDNGDGSYTSTGKVAWIFLDEEEQVGLYSAQITFAKGASGAAGIAFRMTLPNVDYAFEAGCDYLSAQFAPGNGGLQVCSVTEGKWAQMTGSVVPLTSLPESWQQKYNNAQTEITAELSVADYGNKFEIYIDGALAYTFNDASALAAYEGTGFGIRCSTNGADFAEFAYRGPVTVSFESNGGATCASVQWIAGTLALPTPVYEGYALEGWYYDSELQDKVDPADFTATEDVTLYAKWTREYFTVTLNSMGGTACDPIRYTGGAISLPSPTRANFALTGWYYDEACEDPVDASDPQIDSDTTLYAGWRLLTGNVTDNGDGTFTTNDRTAALAGVGEELYSEIVMTLRFAKGASGAVGIMFRASNTMDNAIENGQKYLSVQLSPGNGALQVSRIDSGFAHLTGSLVSLTKLPAAWQEKYNAAESGAEIEAVLKVICGADSFTAYIDGELAYTSSEDDAALIASYTGTGYGLRSSTTPATYSVEYRDLYQVEYVADGETVAYDYLELNASITRTLEDSEVRKDENGYYRNHFTGWYTQAEGGAPVVTVSGNCKLYAHFERVAAEGEFVMVTFHTADGTDVQYLKRGTAAVFPADPSRANYAFTGWYSDEDCTESVTQETLFEADADVYAGWRLLTGKVTDNGDGTFTTTGSTSALAGEGSGLCGEVSMEITFQKGQGGAVGVMFRASNTKDNEIEAGQHYLTVQMVPNGGILQIARIDSGAEKTFVTLTGNKAPLTSLPAAWQEKYNAAEDGESITVTLKVVYDADSFTAYIDGDLAYTSAEEDAQTIASFTGAGYGVRSSTTPATYKVTYTDLEETASAAQPAAAEWKKEENA